MILLKKIIYRDLPNFNSGHVPFLIVPYSPFQKKKKKKKIEHWNLDIIGY